jgi:serine/threonine protein kinase
MSQIDDLIDRWEQLRENGQAISPEELCFDHPELLEEVRWQIQALHAIESHFGCDPDSSYSSLLSANEKTAFQPPSDLKLSGHYRLGQIHASGGLGQVFVAHDESLNRKVAIKFPKRQGMTAGQIARFEQEARITSQLDHPGIVPIHALDVSSDGDPCYVMRFVDGTTLQQTVEQIFTKRKHRIDHDYFQSDGLRHLLQAFVALCNIVAYAHGRDILHRDIKPSNILLGPFGETLLLDWGIAKQLKTDGVPGSKSNLGLQVSDLSSHTSPVQTIQGHSMGTPAYASPEQTHGQSSQIGPASDIYSLGATLFYVLAGKAPLEAVGWSSYLEMLKSTDAKLANYLPSTTPRGLREICNKALQVDPQRRYPSAVSLAADVDRFLAGEPLSALSESWWTKLGRSARKHPTLTGAIVASGLVLMLATAVASAVVTQKNRELSKGNVELRSALERIERSNDVALSALRGMVDEVVALKIAEGVILSGTENNYIQSVLQQYSKLSELQSDSEKARAVQSEAFLHIGMMYYRLDQFDEALPALRTAIQLLDELHANTQSSKYITQLATAYVNVATIEIEQGEADACLATTARATQVITTAGLDLTPDTNYLLLGDMASLHRMRAESFEVKGEPTKAVGELRVALEILDRMFVANSEDTSVQFAIGQVCRMMCSAQSSVEDQAREVLEKTLEFGNRSVRILEHLSETNSNIPRYRMALAWAHFDRATAYRAMREFDSAIADLGIAQSTAAKLADRFPLITAYLECQPGMLTRQAEMLLLRDRLSEATSAYVAAASCLRTIIGKRSGNELFPKMLVETLLDLADVQKQLNDDQGASQSLAEADRTLDALKEVAPDVARELKILLEEKRRP